MLKISASREVLDPLVNNAKAFTSSDLGENSHLHGILVDADKETGIVRFTAENEDSAIEFTSSEIDVEEGGSLLINGPRLRTVLGIMPLEGKVTISQKHERLVHVHAGTTEVDLEVKTVDLTDERALIPNIQDHEDKGVSVLSSDLQEAYRRGSVAARLAGSGGEPIDNVLLAFEETEDSASLSVMTIDKASAFRSVPADNFGDGDLSVLVRPNSMWPILGYATMGDLVTLSYGKAFDPRSKEILRRDTALHLHVYRERKVEVKKGKKGSSGEPSEPKLVDQPNEDTHELLFHIRLSTASADPAKHPLNASSTTRPKVAGMIAEATENYILVNRQGFFDLIDRAARIAHLNRDASQTYVSVVSENGQFKALIHGDTGFEDYIPVTDQNLDKASFKTAWAVTKSLFTTCAEDEDNIRLCIMFRNNAATGLVLMTSGDFEAARERIENGEAPQFPSEYLSIVPLSN